MLLEDGYRYVAEIGDFMRLEGNKCYLALLDKSISNFPDWNQLEGKTFLISGVSGMLGSFLADMIMRYNESLPNVCRCGVIGIGRNRTAAAERFGNWSNREEFTFIEHDVSTPLEHLPVEPDYWIHAASNANPIYYAKDPVGTLLANVQGTKNLLDCGLKHGMKRFLFISSGEVYGQPNANMDDFAEDYCGPLDLSSSRSCYPEGKRAGEILCQSYISQYGVDAAIARPCHLFGPTMTRGDHRSVSEFLWNAVDGRDIVMKSAGLIERSHCYIADAAQALLIILLKGECGRTYNIADQRHHMCIRDFAYLVAEAGGCQVVYKDPNDLERTGYSKINRAVLDGGRLRALGWCAQYDISTGIRETISILREGV